jgi:hypothetical protein
MRTTIAMAALALALIGCAEKPLAPVIAAGPSFTAARFDCGGAPPPPDTQAVPREKQGSAAAGYEERQRAWAQSCKNKLGSVGSELTAAGQVSAPPTAPKAGK